MRLWLKTLRSDMDLSMKDMGNRLGISESYYCAIENGERQKKMDVMLISALATIFEKPVAELIRMETEYSVSHR